LENNSWKDASSISASDQVAEFHFEHLDTLKYIYHMDFEVIFKSTTIALSYSNLREGIDIRGLALSLLYF